MLLRFEVSNHRSIMGPVELSMVAVDEDRPSVKTFELLNEKILTVAGIYGPNASGKSNVLDSLAWLSTAVSRSLRQWENFVPRDPFRSRTSFSTPSTFEVEMMVQGIRYWYRLEVDDEHVITETLYHYPKRVRRMLFERNKGEPISFQRGLRALSGARELLTPTTLVLSVALRYEDAEVTDFAHRLTSARPTSGRPRLIPRRAGRQTYVRPFFSTEQIFTEWGINDEEPARPIRQGMPDRDTALALLQFADLGIDDVRVLEDPADASDEGGTRRRRLQFIHRIGGEEVSFEPYDESDGTQTWFRLMGPVLRALNRGDIVLLDEIDASLHPRLSARLVGLFQDPTINRKNAQLVFSSHDTSLLNHLNRDEVWLTEKGRDGATTLTALAEYGGDKVRRSLNLERAYLQGRFGAVPELDQHVLRRALGINSDES